MKFQITYVQMSRQTRKRIGKSITESINTDVDKRALGARTPADVERRFEGFYKKNSDYDMKVVDVRELSADLMNRCIDEDRIAEVIEKFNEKVRANS